MESKRVQQLPTPSRTDHYAIINSHVLSDIPAELASWSSQSVLIVASAALNSNHSIIRDLKAKLGPIVKDEKLGVGSHTPYEDVIDISRRIHAIHADTVVCIGSCSYSDACKTACLLCASLPTPFTEADMEALVDQEKGLTPPEKLQLLRTKLILVPTTLSASEWNAVSSATNSRGKKQHFGSLEVGAPDLICLDPDVAATTPEAVWLPSGVRGIDHCVEVRCNVGCTGAAAELTERGLRELLGGLSAYKSAKEQGEAGRERLLKGITDCQLGVRDAMTAMLVHGWRVGISHAIGHQLGSVAGVMHGVTSCVMLAPVLKHTETWNPEAQKILLDIFNEVLGWNETTLGEAMRKFVKMLGLPTTLSEVGVTDEKTIETVAEYTLTDVWGGEKRLLNSKEEVMEILNMVR
ncbi:Dehydroquinate synthase-like protein [Viridothelium virens]|uniref:Dehydroquinate synthase-like protein n=1 Tax=Viridothelium virens TaxID=1048519 RepID=A0A6A6H7R5_VIRVR|nr:Dehydroquinate synthase-like protein [Viridothelium virens]